MSPTKSFTKYQDKLAPFLIFLVTGMVYGGVYLSRVLPHPESVSFDRYLFSDMGAALNTLVALLLMGGRWAIHHKRQLLHARLMRFAVLCSVVFIITYFLHHYVAGETRYPGVGAGRAFYLFVLLTHIVLAAVTLPLVLFAAYRGIQGDVVRHKNLVRFAFPLWLYVTLTGIVVYGMISPYYNR